MNSPEAFSIPDVQSSRTPAGSPSTKVGIKGHPPSGAGRTRSDGVQHTIARSICTWASAQLQGHTYVALRRDPNSHDVKSRWSPSRRCWPRMVKRLEAEFGPYRNDFSVFHQQGGARGPGQEPDDYEVTFVGEVFRTSTFSP